MNGSTYRVISLRQKRPVREAFLPKAPQSGPNRCSNVTVNAFRPISPMTETGERTSGGRLRLGPLEPGGRIL